MAGEVKVSERLKGFLDFLTECENDYSYYCAEVDRENQRSWDFVHQMEFTNSAKERSKLATKFREKRLYRRRCKDTMEDLQPIWDALQMPECKKTRNAFIQALGKVRKREQYHENRTYHMKVED